MSLTNDIATALAAKVAGVSGMVGCAATGTDTIPDVPYGVLGAARSSSLSGGGWETEGMDFPLLVFVGRVISASESLQAAYELKDAVQSALRSGITLGLSGSGVTQSLLVDWDTDHYYEVGGEIYQAFGGTIRVSLARGYAGTYTA